jgi:DNA invertase Pin-like site-specific DNA recombinase
LICLVEREDKSRSELVERELAAGRFCGERATMARKNRFGACGASPDLARNVAFISNLMEAGVEFEAVDFPQPNRLTIHIMAAMAEHEAKMISERTRPL